MRNACDRAIETMKGITYKYISDFPRRYVLDCDVTIYPDERRIDHKNGGRDTAHPLTTKEEWKKIIRGYIKLKESTAPKPLQDKLLPTRRKKN